MGKIYNTGLLPTYLLMNQKTVLYWFCTLWSQTVSKPKGISELMKALEPLVLGQWNDIINNCLPKWRWIVLAIHFRTSQSVWSACMREKRYSPVVYTYSQYVRWEWIIIVGPMIRQGAFFMPQNRRECYMFQNIMQYQRVSYGRKARIRKYGSTDWEGEIYEKRYLYCMAHKSAKGFWPWKEKSIKWLTRLKNRCHFRIILQTRGKV